MAQNNQWMLFGIDMRHIGQHWLSAWRDLLFADASPVRRRFDEPVVLHNTNGQQVFQGGARADRETASRLRCDAVQLPDELSLCRAIKLPLAVEAEMAAVLAMEVDTYSPFTQADTVYGYTEMARDEQTISLCLAIASRSAVNNWLRESTAEFFEHDVEVWVEADSNSAGGFVTLKGFGEGKRDSAYRGRLQNVSAMLGGILVLALLAASVFAVHQKSLLQQAQQLQREVQNDARSVAKMREVLASANETIHASNAVHEGFPNPHVELARLTELLTDDEFITHLSIRGRDLRLRGRATDAAVVMQTLAKTNAFESVTAPQAITAVGNTGMEQFYLDIDLASREQHVGEEPGTNNGDANGDDS